MTISIALHPLHRADGSATYTDAATKTSIVCGVNFPVDAPARSSLPDQCYVEVHIRPHNGVGQVRERHLECLVADTLRGVVLLDMYPRMMLQVTLQVMGRGRDEEADISGGGGGGGGGGGQGESYLPVLAGLVNAAVAGCLDAGVGMKGVVVAATVAVMVVEMDGNGNGKVEVEMKVDPGVKDFKKARSLHVLGFGSGGDLMLVESEGRFSFDEWERVEAVARMACLGGGAATTVGESGDVKMNDEEASEAGRSLHDVLRGAVETRVVADDRWRGG